MTIHVSGQELHGTPLDVITTDTGEWPVTDLGPIEGGHAYLFGLKSRPEWWSLCLARDPIPNDFTVAEKFYTVAINSTTIKMSVLGGSIRCVDNGEPVAPSMARLQQAVADKRVLPYRPSAFSGWSTAADWAFNYPANYAEYFPDRIYGRDPGHSAIGTVSAVGGEYSSSRGFLSGEDALMIAAALKGDSALFAEVAHVNRSQMLYGLSMDNFAIWSDANNSLRDPQRPLPGDKAYAVGTDPDKDHWARDVDWCAPADYKYLADLGATAGTCYYSHRNGEHLFNHGFAYWLATGDPRAALLQEVIAAYALSAPYDAPSDGAYHIQFAYQRWTLNIFSAMWKLRDVAQHLSTENGTMFWPKPRSQKMWTDVLADWKARIAGLDASNEPKWQAMSAAFGYDETPTLISNFMAQGYGPEAAYLWASAGDGALLTRLAGHMAWRVNALGGTLAMLGEGGSTFLDLRTDPPTGRAAIEAYLKAAQPDRATTSFDDAPYHYTLRAYWLLKMAQDAAQRGWMPPVDGVDAAIAKMEAERDATASWRDKSVLGWKHAAVTF